MPIGPNETDLVGEWIVVEGEVCGNPTEQRIENLIRRELQRLATDASGWELLFLDPADGRLWELTYPRSEMHGGGPRRLHVIDATEARRKYKLD